MDEVWNGVGILLIVSGLAGAWVPMLPGLPLIFGGIWLIAAVDGYRHFGPTWLAVIGCIGALGILLDLLAGALGAQRVGASSRAVAGAVLGTIVGLAFGIPGLLFGPFAGAMIGELSAGKTFEQSARVGAGTWLGLIFGTMAKLVASVTMVALFAALWWWRRDG